MSNDLSLGHDWLVKNLQIDPQIISIPAHESLSDNQAKKCEKKFLDDIKSISNQIESSDVTIRVHNQTLSMSSCDSLCTFILFSKIISFKFQ